MPAITQRHFDLSSPNQGCFSLHAVYLIFGRLSLSFITTLLLPARRSFVSFQRSSPGQTFIPLCQRVKEGKQAGSPGYVLTLEGCIQFCFLHCCVFAESTSQRKSDWQRARLKRCLAGQRICPLFPRDQGVFSSFFHVLLYARISVFHLIYIIFFGLFFNCHSTWPPPANIPSLIAGFESRGGMFQALIPWWDKDERPFGMDRDSLWRWRSMTSCVRKVIPPRLASGRGRPVCRQSERHASVCCCLWTWWLTPALAVR